jgi:O-antigen/teichoic acid export membrane protein
MRKAQAVTTFCTWAGFVFSVGIFIIFIFFGDLVLSLFGESYKDGKIILLLLSAGLLVDAATGPTRIVMMMTGHEKPYVAIFGSIMIIGFIFQFALISTYGIIGVAVINMITRIVAQSAIAYWASKKIGISTTLWGYWMLPKDLKVKVKTKNN